MDAERIDMTRLLSHGQVTDSYLLALAKAHGGRLASLDKNWWWALSRVASKRLS